MRLTAFVLLRTGKKMEGIFTISLDFELHWGGFEKWLLEPLAPSRKPQASVSSATEQRITNLPNGQAGNYQPATNYNQYFLNTRQVIPKLLQLFERHEVHVLWATVGMLMHQNKESLVANLPDRKPSYVHNELSAYHFMDSIGIGDNEDNDPFHYAHSLVTKILDTPYQELGSHTFAHYYCNEAGQTVEQFRADLQAAQKAASAYGVKLKSLVFPRNQFNDAYLKVCYEEGFSSVRSNPVDWFWKIETRNESMWKRLNRGLDAYVPLGSKNAFRLSSLDVRDGFPVCIPASRLLRPYRPKELMLNQCKIKRILNEMTQAAKAGDVYHLWWHPHNFGWYPAENLEGLRAILQHYAHLKRQYGMTSMSMGEMVDAVTGS
ncbi:MAG: polysaccharide deacetylase family protein [Cyclobacteriaceae bacterium]|nr:polysaccharide deacetylase family protein [Cyclobacteriaceae bacterium]